MKDVLFVKNVPYWEEFTAKEVNKNIADNQS